MNKRKAIEELEANIGCIELDVSNGKRPLSEKDQAFIDACACAIKAIEGSFRNDPVPAVKVDWYGANKYFCPACRKQQKETRKNYKSGCYCERCGQRLEAFKNAIREN